MKILFWNIGRALSKKKQELIKEAIIEKSPDIFCIAEGSFSIIDCQIIIDLFETNSYYCYYSPLFYQINKLKLNYKYTRNGLKVFIKDKLTLVSTKSFV